jgi:hypothetical protein
MVDALVGEVEAEKRAQVGPWINTTSYSVPIYTVPAGQPTIAVELTHHSADAALSAAWREVPLPANAHPAAGSDGDLVVWQPSSQRMWEFWKLAHVNGSWQANWGGAMRDTPSQRGVYGPWAWPGAKTYWGASASSLSLIGGLITLDDLQRGVIDHALAMAVPSARAETYASPAQRDDGTSHLDTSLPEGARLRLNPNLDLTQLHLPEPTLTIARAAQRYGIFVTDSASNVAFYGQDPTPTGANPYRGPAGLFAGMSPLALLATFPWSQLEVVALDLHHGT